MAIHCNRRGRGTQIHITRHFFSCTVRTLNDVHSHHGSKNVFVRITPYSWSSMLCGCPFIDSLFLALFLSVCLSYPLLFSFHFYLDPVLEPLLPCGQRQGKKTLALRQMRSPAPGPNSLLSQVMRPSSLTTSTTRRLLKSSSGTNPATKTRCPRTCLTRNSTMRPSGKCSLHHCSFRSEKNQRTEDKLSLL